MIILTVRWALHRAKEACTSSRSIRGDAMSMGKLLRTALPLLVGFACIGPLAPDARYLQLLKQAGHNQIGHLDAPLDPFVVKVVDEQFRAVTGAAVLWSLAEGGGVLSPTSSATDGDGFASTVLVPAAGGNRVVATLEGTGPEVEFTALACRERCEDLEVASRLPEGRAWADGTVHGGTIWVLGGEVEDALGATREVLLYDPSMGLWQDGTPLPAPRAAGVVASVDDRIHYIGGHRGSFDMDVGESSVLTLDPTSGVWTSGAALPTGRFHAAAAVVDGRIYVAGGVTRCWWFDGACDSPVAMLEIYDPVADRWTTGAPMNVARALAGAAVVEGKVWVAGGGCRFAYPGCFASGGVVEEYDPATDRWTRRASLPLAGPTRLAVVDGALFAYVSTAVTGGVFEYDHDTETWWPLSSSIPDHRIGAVFAGVRDELLVIGGLTPGLRFHETVLALRR